MAFLPLAEAAPDKIDMQGARFRAGIPVTGPNGKTVDVLTVWIYGRVKGQNALSTRPRLITIFIPEDSHAF